MIRLYTPSGTLHQDDSLELMAALEPASVDSIITDPPYGVLNHRIETGVDKDAFFAAAFRLLKPNSFIAFFGQYPTLPAWTSAAEQAGFKFHEQIVWVKRVPSSPWPALSRVHESFMVYRKGSPKYYVTKGRYEDVKFPGILFDTSTIDVFQRVVKELRRQLAGLGVNVRNSDPVFAAKAAKKNELWKTPRSPYVAYPEHVNFTNVWSFLPNNNRERSANRAPTKKGPAHPTVKSLPFMRRAIELLTPAGGTVLDPFLGSGTTALAAIQSGFPWIGIELDPTYCDLASDRIAEELEQSTIPLTTPPPEQ